MRYISSSYKLIAGKYLLSLGIIYLTQAVFYLFNSALFHIDGAKDLFSIFLGCTRYALSSLSVYLAPFLIMSLLPVTIKAKRPYRAVTETFYILANLFMMVVNLIDVGYFRFTFKRLTSDITRYLGVGGDFKELIPQFLRDYWHIVLLFVVLLTLFLLVNRWLNKRYKPEPQMFSRKFIIVQGTAFVVIAGLLFIAQRGGLQTRPLNLMHASQYTGTQNTALVLNTPFTLYRTFNKPALERKDFFDSTVLNNIYNPHIQPQQSTWADTLFGQPLQLGRTNVVVIILESFSAEYLSTYNRTGVTYTPFLDSLARKSIVFQGLANGKRSIDGIPSVVSSLPLMMEESYLTSTYGENKLSSIASSLVSKGYSSAFFHGGYNGTMNFDNYTKKVGYRHYYGKNQYNDDRDYDGNWGIYDEPFLQYTVKQLDTISKPFVATIFTLSSHHPYKIPEQHKGRFPKGTMIVHETVGYTDYALKRFFESASKSDWFENTLFVITADHSAICSQKEFKTQLGLFRIPMIIYHPSLRHGHVSQAYMQQTDIYPAIMDLLHFDKRIFAFGRSPFAPGPHYYIYYTNGEYLLMIGDYMSKYKEGCPIELYNVKKDVGLKNNIYESHKDVGDFHLKFIKAVIQQYNNSIIGNKTV